MKRKLSELSSLLINRMNAIGGVKKMNYKNDINKNIICEVYYGTDNFGG